jgi:PiT family inorganic phosphate transporter
MATSLILIVFIVFLALAFDFLNGFHDAANSIATIVSTQVLKPYTAVLWAAFFNFIAFLFFKLQVASTIGTGIVNPAIVDPLFIMAALVGAISWNILTWYFGIPSSSSHALIGGLLGVAWVKSGWQAINITGISKVLIAIVLSPLLGLVIGLVLMFIIARIFFRAPRQRVDKIFRKLQLVSSALISLGHGGNDAQKTMGVIAILLFSAGLLGPNFYVPLWVVITCNLTIALGTMCGGWRIVRTMGMKITKLQPVSGFAAETASAITIAMATSIGAPLSTTHTITGAIMGVGSLQRASAVRWAIAKDVVLAWIITMPASGLVAACTWYLVRKLF